MRAPPLAPFPPFLPFSLPPRPLPIPVLEMTNTARAGRSTRDKEARREWEDDRACLSRRDIAQNKNPFPSLVRSLISHRGSFTKAIRRPSIFHLSDPDKGQIG